MFVLLRWSLIRKSNGSHEEMIISWEVGVSRIQSLLSEAGRLRESYRSPIGLQEGEQDRLRVARQIFYEIVSLYLQDIFGGFGKELGNKPP